MSNDNLGNHIEEYVSMTESIVYGGRCYLTPVNYYEDETIINFSSFSKEQEAALVDHYHELVVEVNRDSRSFHEEVERILQSLEKQKS